MFSRTQVSVDIDIGIEVRKNKTITYMECIISMIILSNAIIIVCGV